jgi:metal-sulfur cluster biosynthetic enzyme
MPLSEDTVREELKKVFDPELFINIVDLGLVYLIVVQPREDGKSDVKIEMTMTSPMCPAGPQLIDGCQRTLTQLPEANAVEVRLVMAPPWTPDRMTEEARDQLGIF